MADSKKKKIIYISVGVVVLIGVIFGAMSFFGGGDDEVSGETVEKIASDAASGAHGSAADGEESKEGEGGAERNGESKVDPLVIVFEPFRANPVDTPWRGFEVHFIAKVKDAKTKANIASAKYQIRDAFSTMIASRTYKEMISPKGKELLKREAQSKLQQYGEVEYVSCDQIITLQ